MEVIGKGVYSITEAARLTQLRPSRVRDWFRTIGDDREGQALFQGDYPPIGNDRAISFLDLVEVYIVGKLRDANPPVSLQHIRKVHRKLSHELAQKHPFCTHDIYHGHGKIFARKLDDASGSVIEPLTDQTYINAVIIPFLEKIDYDHISKLAKLWRIAEGIVVDPTRSFGKPIVAAIGISTRVLASAYEANGRDADRVADWYEIEPNHVHAAVNFETRSAA